MAKIKLSKNQKSILNSLRDGDYPSLIPDKDADDIFVLKEFELITAIEVSDKSGRMLICPDLTDRGRAYIACNPTLKNPTIWDDRKYIINMIISVAALIVAIIALFK